MARADARGTAVGSSGQHDDIIAAALMLRLPPFTYRQPKSVGEALDAKRDAGPHGMYVAGGTDLYPNMKRRQQEPQTVISLMGIPELRATEGRKGDDGGGRRHDPD